MWNHRDKHVQFATEKLYLRLCLAWIFGTHAFSAFTNQINKSERKNVRKGPEKRRKNSAERAGENKIDKAREEGRKKTHVEEEIRQNRRQNERSGKERKRRERYLSHELEYRFTSQQCHEIYSP